VLASRVVINKKAYGSRKGPNAYFSETLKRRRDWFFRTLAKELERDAFKR
jgi:hypothetical protein